MNIGGVWNTTESIARISEAGTYFVEVTGGYFPVPLVSNNMDIVLNINGRTALHVILESNTPKNLVTRGYQMIVELKAGDILQVSVNNGCNVGGLYDHNMSGFLAFFYTVVKKLNILSLALCCMVAETTTLCSLRWLKR